MSRKQIFLVAMIGLILTGLVSILPRYINPYLLKSSLLPRHTLDGENDLAELLREAQREEGIYDQTDFDLVTAHWGETGTPGWIRGDVKPDGVINTLDLMIVSQHQRDKKVYIGVHGYDHKCPLCGGTDHELYCVHDKIPREEVERRVDEGLKIFAEAGLKADWYGFPGMTYDERCLEILRNRGFTTVKYYFKVNWLELDMAVSPSMVDIDWSEHTMEEYTWMWRDGVSEQEFQETLDLITVNSPIQILMHIRDFTDQTKALLEYAIDNCGTTLIRCDDITFNNDAPNTENLVRLAKEHDVTLLICVIPSFAYVPSSSFVPFIEATWYMFLCFFVFPVALMVPWAGIFKSKREKPKLKGNPYFPKVSLILPAYNEEKILGKSIKQGLNQDYKGEIEIIVIDDGSTDKTYKIARRYAKKYSNVKVIQHKENLGKPAALNTGFGHATGKISIFSDTDSVLASDLVSKMVPHFEDPKVGMVAGMIVIKNEKNL
ncbi:MAG: glycosyltransferase, partial [Asgard group archaeon]